MSVTECEGYQKLKTAAEHDDSRDPWRKKSGEHWQKLQWIVDRAEHYAQATGLNAADILNAWESRRNYWYMNYYQDSNQPLIKDDKVRVFDTIEDLLASVKVSEYRCPACNGITRSPYICTTGLPLSEGRTCDWKVGGLFGHMGKGTYIFIKEKMVGENIFMPVAWEGEEAQSESPS